jgi:two-component system chemotaxis response regulator CheY
MGGRAKMSFVASTHTILVADPVSHTRNLVSEVLRSMGFEKILNARDGADLLRLTVQYDPRIVITTSRLPGLSGLEYTRLIRGGYETVSRVTSIIVMTDTPTRSFLSAARESGADEMLVRPFTAHAIVARVRSVLERPREFVDSAVYTGPCRRRRMLPAYAGPRRRFLDPTDDMPGAMAWESEENRAAVRKCVQKIGEVAKDLAPGDRRKLQQVFRATKDAESFADETLDAMMGAAARSLGRYISSIGSSGAPDPEVMRTHIDAMHTLSVLSSSMHVERQQLVNGLVRVVDKRLGRSVAA